MGIATKNKNKNKTKPILDLIAKVVRTSKTYVIPEITFTIPAEGQKIHGVSIMWWA